VSSAAHVAHWGTYVTTPNVSASGATIRIRTSIEKRGGASDLELETTILDPAGKSVASSRTGIADAHEIDQEFDVKSPALWAPEHPSLYVARSVILQSGDPVDDYVTSFGIREVRFDKDRGFLLNGQVVKLKGVCLHHDGGCVGAAVPDRVLERRLEILKEIGCNAIRCAHNPPSPELLDFCDKMGFLVIDEAFDKWVGDFSKPKEWWMRQAGFAENWQQDLRAMLERDRNHPSIILWSVGNETGQAGTDEVDPTLKKLVDFVHREEPSRAVTAALCNSSAHTLDDRVARIVTSSKLMDVLCLNYQEPLYERIRAANPNTVIIGSETFKYFRGGEMNVHSFEPVNPWFDVLKHDYVAGGFIWTGIDYLGESTRFPLRGSPVGIIDTCGFLQPEGWFQRSMWRDDPVVRIAVLTGEHQIASSWGAPATVEHWNFPNRDGQLIQLQTQTNCKTVELILNGKSYGRRSSKDYPNRAIAWFAPYHPGTIEALARNEGEQIIARHELKTAGPVARIELHVDRETICADGQDVAHVVAELVDEHVRRVPDCDTAMQFSVEGPGTIIGVDNGDLTDPKLFAKSSRETRHGRCLAVVQSQRKSGEIHLIAEADGYKVETMIRSIDVQSGKSN
jgi:beta-galactosidase